MFTLSGGGEWMCKVPESEWPGAGDQEVIDAIKLDFMGEWGDRELFLPANPNSTISYVASYPS